MYYVYLIQSESDGSFYIGYTSDLTDRLLRHNTNRSRYTRGRGPWRLLGYKSFRTRGEAMIEERRFLLLLVNPWFLCES